MGTTAGTMCDAVPDTDQSWIRPAGRGGDCAGPHGPDLAPGVAGPELHYVQHLPQPAWDLHHMWHLP